MQPLPCDYDMMTIIFPGGHVWCDGEDMRPRKIFIQLPGGKPSSRCACMEGMGWTDVRQVRRGRRPREG